MIGTIKVMLPVPVAFRRSDLVVTRLVLEIKQKKGYLKGSLKVEGRV
jgi:hypothetical protein